MANLRKRGPSQWQAQVRVCGYPNQTKTFNTRAEAERWAKAAEVEIPRLQADIAKAKAAGLKPEQIAEGEEKLRRIQQMRDQLASEHPEVLRQ